MTIRLVRRDGVGPIPGLRSNSASVSLFAESWLKRVIPVVAGLKLWHCLRNVPPARSAPTKGPAVCLSSPPATPANSTETVRHQSLHLRKVPCSGSARRSMSLRSAVRCTESERFRRPSQLQRSGLSAQRVYLGKRIDRICKPVSALHFASRTADEDPSLPAMRGGQPSILCFHPTRRRVPRRRE